MSQAEVPGSRLHDLRGPDGSLLLSAFSDSLLLGTWYLTTVRVPSQLVSTSTTQNIVLSLPWEPSWDVYLSFHFSKYAWHQFFPWVLLLFTLRHSNKCDLKKKKKRPQRSFMSFQTAINDQQNKFTLVHGEISLSNTRVNQLALQRLSQHCHSQHC